MNRIIAAGVALTIGLVAAAPAQAQSTAYSADGRPEFCVMVDIAGNRQLSDELVGLALDELGYSRYAGVGQRVMNQSQRLVGWLFYGYSQDAFHWRNTDAAGRDTVRFVDYLISDRDGAVPTLQDRYIPNFNRAAIGCRSSVRG
jgi:hypothetical protein